MKNKKWTKEEDEILKDSYNLYGIDYCLEKLNRTKRSIQLRVRKLKLTPNVSVKKRWRKEKLKPIVDESKTYVECLKKLGIKNFGSSTNTLKKYINKYNLDISHFIHKEEQIKKLSLKIPIEKILSGEVKYSNRTRLKERLYKEGYKNRECELCGQTEEWQGKRMSLILDHINGINDDNRIENLRILCPNCNATLDTHCRGNVG